MYFIFYFKYMYLLQVTEESGTSIADAMLVDAPITETAESTTPNEPLVAQETTLVRLFCLLCDDMYLEKVLNERKLYYCFFV